MADTIPSGKCSACGKTYVWKPEYGGKNVKCECGTLVKPPAQPVAAPANIASRVKSAPAQARSSVTRPAPAPPAAPAEEQSHEEALSDFEQAIAGADFELTPVAPPVAPIAPLRVTRVTAPKAGVAVASPLLGYAKPRPRPAEDDGTQAARLHDFYIPIGLIVVGVVLSFVDAWLMGIHHLAIAAIYVVLMNLVNLVMVFVALMAGVKLIDLGLGPVGTAMLKITAVAILPSAVSGIIGHWTMGLMSWSMSAVCYYLLLFYLFEMDSKEMMIVTAIIWGIRLFISIFLFFGLLRLIGASLPGGGSGAPRSLHGGSSSITIPSANPNPPAATAADTDAQAAGEIASGRVYEARQWLDPQYANHVGFRMGKLLSASLVERLYAAGATEVYAAGVAPVGQNLLCDHFLIELPDDPAARLAVRGVVDDITETGTPSRDDGGRYLLLRLD